MKNKYSGKHSKKFWNAINSIKDESSHDELYSLGVKLQNLEESVLKKLDFETKKEKEFNLVNIEIINKRLNMLESGNITLTELLYQLERINKNQSEMKKPEEPKMRIPYCNCFFRKCKCRE